TNLGQHGRRGPMKELDDRVAWIGTHPRDESGSDQYPEVHLQERMKHVRDRARELPQDDGSHLGPPPSPENPRMPATRAPPWSIKLPGNRVIDTPRRPAHFKYGPVGTVNGNCAARRDRTPSPPRSAPHPGTPRRDPARRRGHLRPPGLPRGADGRRRRGERRRQGHALSVLPEQAGAVRRGHLRGHRAAAAGARGSGRHRRATGAQGASYRASRAGLLLGSALLLLPDPSQRAQARRGGAPGGALPPRALPRDPRGAANPPCPPARTPAP